MTITFKKKDINKSRNSDLDTATTTTDQEKIIEQAVMEVVNSKKSIEYSCYCKYCKRNYKDFGITSICDNCLSRAFKNYETNTQ